MINIARPSKNALLQILEKGMKEDLRLIHGLALPASDNKNSVHALMKKRKHRCRKCTDANSEVLILDYQ